jgi:hypothetical protein
MRSPNIQEFTDFSAEKHKKFFKKVKKALDFFLRYSYISYGSGLWAIFHEPILLPLVY